VNGGTTWTVKPLFPLLGYAQSLSCPTVSVCYALGQTSIHDHFVMKTVNGGASWSRHPSGFVIDWTISCTSATSCVALGSSSTRELAIRTSNGGRSWASATIPGGFQDVWKLSCGTPLACLGVGDVSTAPHSLEGATIRTANGGVSWSADPPFG
jgi:hypothetical protein